ncbi:RecQ family ATP-dependent DNA helicase [Saccharopolyspora shandongensis]|uniref:RecQ family ATP-dependent DNA helicase n=1 Tax=Saccharopolyspora shandongensis TaxID=418495 RepID=UPI0033C3F436
MEGIEVQREAERLLSRAFGSDAAFQDGQIEAIDGLVVGRARLLLVQRTGWGKSLVYFMATKLLRDAGAGPTVVISPLLALMRDQTASAERLGLRAATINSSNTDDWETIELELLGGRTDILLISPERLNNPDFRERLLQPLTRVAGLLVVDEAHCISDWGHDFRPDYRRLVRVIGLLPSNVPILCTTATANNRVIEDIREQLGENLRLIRGTLDRDSLELSVVHLDSQPERLAWLAEWIPTVDGSGIVYCLTVGDAERVAEWLQQRGIEAIAYTGETDGQYRLDIEDRLRNNDVKVVASTSALGMGFDKPDLAFVVHFQSPDSPVAYYQQVGRAGRALPRAAAVLLVGQEDARIWQYFLDTSLPVQAVAEEVVSILETNMDWMTTGAIEERINVARGRLTALLKVLEVEGAIEPQKREYRRTLAPWSFDRDRVERVRQARVGEQQLMREYASSAGCRMAFLRTALDDSDVEPCGRCDNCTGTILRARPDRALVRKAQAFIRHRPVIIEPRKQWTAPRSGRIPVDAQLQPGRALGYLNDAGWGQDLLDAKHSGSPVHPEMVEAAADLIREWLPDFGGVVVSVPSRDPSRTLVPDLARRIAIALGRPYSACVVKVRDTKPQKLMQNSAQQLGNILDAFAIREPAPSRPVLLVDDVSDSRWTMTVIGALLADAGAGPVYPFVIARAAG